MIEKYRPQLEALQTNLFDEYQGRLDPIRKRAQQVMSEYGQFSEIMPSYSQRLIDAIKRAGQYPSTAAIRSEFMEQPNLTPAAIEALTAKRAAAGRGSVSDIVSRATGGFQGMMAGRAAEAERLGQRETGLLQRYQLEQAGREAQRGGLLDLYQAELTEAQLPGGQYYVPPVRTPKADETSLAEVWELVQGLTDGATTPTGAEAGLYVQDPNTGDLYEANDEAEYSQLLSQGFLPYFEGGGQTEQAPTPQGTEVSPGLYAKSLAGVLQPSSLTPEQKTQAEGYGTFYWGG